MTLRERLKKMVMTANGATIVMSGELAESVMPNVLRTLDDKADELGHDMFDYEREADEYPDILYTALWIYIRPVIFSFLENEHPNFVNRSCYMTSEQRGDVLNDD